MEIMFFAMVFMSVVLTVILTCDLQPEIKNTKEKKIMGSSANLDIGVGVLATEVFEITTEKRKRPQYNPETGEKFEIEYEQTVVKAFGIEIPHSQKLVRPDRPSLGFDTSSTLFKWLGDNGFDTELVNYHHSNLNYVSNPTGIVGIKLRGDYSPLQEIEINEATNQLSEVELLLKKVGMKEGTAKLYAHAYLC